MKPNNGAERPAVPPNGQLRPGPREDSPPDPLLMALQYMEAAIELLDASGAAPIGTSEYLDLAIHNLASSVDPSAEARLRRLRRTASFDQELDCP